MVDFDIVIAGYGPAGAVAANLLGAYGHRVLVVEPKREIYDLPRAVHFDGEVMRIFQGLGLAQEISEVAAEGRELAFTNGRNWQLFEQDLSLVPRQHGWYNNWFFNQPELERALRRGVTRYPNVEVRLGWAVSGVTQAGDVVEVHLEGSGAGGGAVTEAHRTERTSYLLACDGASSPIRGHLGIAQEDLRCDEPWLVCDLMLEAGTPIKRQAVQICDPARPTSLIPCVDGHIRWEFMLNDDDDLDAIEDEAVVRRMMAPHLWRLSPNLEESAGDLVRAKVYQFHALVAETFQRGRTFLLGDAAHQMPPFLGQGMCAGVRDAYNLCWKLDRVLHGESSPEILRSYSTERSAQVREVIKTAVAHGRIIQARNPLTALARDCFLKLGRVVPALVSFLKFGEGWYLGPGIFSSDKMGSGDPVGLPIPQARLVRSAVEAQQHSDWSDNLLSGGITVVGFDVDPAPILARLNSKLAVSGLLLDSTDSAMEAESSDGAMLTQWAADEAVALAIVRPDRQVYGVCSVGTDLEAGLGDLLLKLEGQLQ